MTVICYKCSKDLGLRAGEKVGRRDVCPNCKSDVHACLNCKFYDKASYNECKEPQADRVLDKAASNFCDYFELSGSGPSAKDEKSTALKKLDDLFK